MNKASPHLAMGEGAEFDAIRRLLTLWGPNAVGIGDDAAVLDIPAGERLVVSTDASVEHVHFKREWLSAEEIGARATAAALSDLAAMAATPRGLLVALGIPDNWRRDVEAVARGIGAAAAAAECAIVGGNITKAGELSLTITVLGSARNPISRAGALPGDDLYVTGSLGGPGVALSALLAGNVPEAPHRARFAAPVPRLREGGWLAAHGARAAIDISDGLVGDATHLAVASGVSITLDENAIPRMDGVRMSDALASGEEYELLVAMPARATVDCTEFERDFGIPLTWIGTATAAGSPHVRFLSGLTGVAGGHDHLL